VRSPGVKAVSRCLEGHFSFLEVKGILISFFEESLDEETLFACEKVLGTK